MAGVKSAAGMAFSLKMMMSGNRETVGRP